MTTGKVVNRGEDQFVLLPAGCLPDCDEVNLERTAGGVVVTPRPRDRSRPLAPDPDETEIVAWLRTQTA